MSFIAKNLDGELPWESSVDLGESDPQGRVNDACKVQLPREFNEMNLSGGLEDWMSSVYLCNQYVDAEAPWALRKADPARMQAVLAVLFVCIRDLAIAVLPVVPSAAGMLLDQMGIAADERSYAALDDDTWYERLRASGFRLAPPTPIFPRLEMPPEAS